MDWEEIEHQAKNIVIRLVAELTRREDQETEKEEEDNVLVREFLETGVLQQEQERRGKYDYQKAFGQIHQEKRRKMIWRISTAAACIALITGSIGFYLNGKSDPSSPPIAAHTPDRQEVVLRLSNGKSVSLSTKDSLQLEEGNKAIQVQGGRIVYQTRADWNSEPELRYNTLSVPCGAEYQLELADGTKVHLNAASELKYPVVFSSESRKVELKGEAWFEVAKDTTHPFYVIADGVQIRVYGTAFNVNTHRLQTIQTVLIEGSIGIKAGNSGDEFRMKPGQLAEYTRKDKQIHLKTVDVRQYTAWKEGFFYFNEETLEDIMGELTRWYNMEVFFRTNWAKGLHFTGHLARYEDIRKILSTMTESTGVEFDIHEKTITVK